MGTYGRHVPAVARAIDLLEAVGDARDGLTSGQLEDVVDGSRSGLFALLNTLKDRSWLAQDPAGRYRVGPGLRRVAPPLEQDDDALRTALDDVLADLRVDETVALVRPAGSSRLVIAVHEPDRPVRCAYGVGQERGDGGADARACAPDGLDDDAVARVVGDEAVEIAAPICRDGHLPIAAVVVGVPRQRADDDHLAAVARVVRDLAIAVSLRLGAPRWQPWGAASRSEHLEPGRPLAPDEVEELLRGRHGAQLACLREDGTPHVVPLWFDWDGESMWLTASPGASWAGYVGTGSHVSLNVEEPWPALRRVFVTGWAEPVTTDEVDRLVDGGLDGLRRRMAARHLGAEQARSMVTSGDGWTAIRVVPDRIHGRAGLAEAAA
ncbi:pyridoxamine 5'-phosphate oxidase family protein [Salsipaludibacter albus]|uniref:pyridoxamine 5'-phosphate oxidase family protein n=1 Tax=Salsipaludibacter albus TaxID=2849650 RepID=UPI0030844724|nr:pyridoxamine 5'-phosphate oxidase family protein [Salsipaludibacter albus]